MNKENGIKRLNRLSVQAKEYRDENTQVVKLSQAIEVIELIDQLEPEITEHEAWKIIMREHHYHISPSYVEEYKKAIQDGVIPSDLNKIKPVIPQFVADWIEYCKKCYWDLSSFLSLENMAKSKAPISKENRRLLEKYRLDGNLDAMARAWLNGYEVEETLYYMPLPYQSNSTIYYYKQDDGKISFKQGGMMKDHSKFTQEELDKYFPEIKHMAVEVQE